MSSSADLNGLYSDGIANAEVRKPVYTKKNRLPQIKTTRRLNLALNLVPMSLASLIVMPNMDEIGIAKASTKPIFVDSSRNLRSKHDKYHRIRKIKT